MREHPLEVQSASQHLIHAPHHKQRWSIVNALNNANDDLRRRARRLGLCCSTPTLRTRGSDVFPCLQRCRDRLCPLCSTHRGREAAAKACKLTESMNAPRFITLTTKANNLPLFLRLRHLVCSFNALRKTDEWKKWVKGGIYALEVTYNASSGQWHPHLHVIADGEYIPQPKLRSMWQKITGDSFVVDVRAIPDRAKAARYIATYVAKPFDVSNWPADAIREYAETLHGVRMINAFGSCHKANPVDTDAAPEVEEPSRHLLHGSQIAAYARKSKVIAHAAEILSRMGTYHAVAVERKPAAKSQPVEEWERRYAISVLTSLSLWVPGDLPADFDFRFTPDKVLSADLAAELTPGEIPGDSGQGYPDPHADAADLMTLFDGHGDTPVPDRVD